MERKEISPGRAALIAGLTVLLPTVPYAEFWVFGKLIVHNDAGRTMQNLSQHPQLFLSGIFAILFTLLIDMVCAWAIYIFLRPVNASISLLSAWFRLASAILAMVATFYYLQAYELVSGLSTPSASPGEQLLQLVHARRLSMRISYIVFGVYLVLVSVLIIRASYIPNVLGGLLMMAGVAWIGISLQPYFFKNYDLSWMMVFTVGELFWMLWLLVKGSRIKGLET